MYNRSIMTYHFHVVITQDESGMYIAHVPTLHGCHTQAKTLPVLHKRLQEAIALCVEVEQAKKKPISRDKFVGVEEVAVNV